MPKKSMLRTLGVLGALVSLLTFVGCRPTHNQTVIPQEWQNYFNAEPANSNYLQTNREHKVLIAIIDSGTDYNHPLLKDHIHYDIAANDKAIGAGWDFLGNDPWPSPYLARTRHLYSNTSQAKAEETQILANINKLIELQPKLQQWLYPHRHHADETVLGSYHGTHVAGLASYDDPRIGLIPYRILPHQEALNNKVEDPSDSFYVALEGAIIKAHAAGVKVINMSLGTSFGKSDRGAEHMIELFKKFEALVNRYPDMAFVAAAGNEKTWVNGETRYSFPCGIKAPNMLCVASTDKDGVPSEFTNIPLITSPLVFAPGEKILAPAPTHYCQSSVMENVSTALDDEEMAELANRLIKDCSAAGPSPLMPLSGTSMASPIIARVVAQESLNLAATATGEEVIRSFMSHSQTVRQGVISISKFRVPLPSWYPKNSETQGLGLRPSSMTRGYFEFYLKK